MARVKPETEQATHAPEVKPVVKNDEYERFRNKLINLGIILTDKASTGNTSDVNETASIATNIFKAVTRED